MTTPKRPRRVETASDPAVWMVLQHCKFPVLHWLAGIGVEVDPGAVTVTVVVTGGFVAAARRANAKNA